MGVRKVKELYALYEKYPTLNSLSIRQYYYDHGKDIHEAEEYAKRMFKLNENKDRINSIAKKYNRTRRAVRQLLNSLGIGIAEATNEDFERMDRIYYSKCVVPVKIREFCEELGLNYYTSLRYLNNRNIYLNEIGDEKELNKIKERLINEHMENVKVYTGEKKWRNTDLKFDIGDKYYNFKHFYKENNLKISFSHALRIYDESSTKEEFFEALERKNNNAIRYTKENFEELNKKLYKIADENNLKHSSIQSYWLDRYFGITKRDLIDNPELIEIVCVTISEKSKNKPTRKKYK